MLTGIADRTAQSFYTCPKCANRMWQTKKYKYTSNRITRVECELQIAWVCQSKISISWSICSPHFHTLTHVCDFNWAGRKEKIFQRFHMKISTLRIIFTFVIAALNPAWHEPCLWYPQNTGNREKWRRLWLVIVFITCKWNIKQNRFSANNNDFLLILLLFFPSCRSPATLLLNDLSHKSNLMLIVTVLMMFFFSLLKTKANFCESRHFMCFRAFHRVSFSSFMHCGSVWVVFNDSVISMKCKTKSISIWNAVKLFFYSKCITAAAAAAAVTTQLDNWW